jgi:hypothetical protein
MHLLVCMLGLCAYTRTFFCGQVTCCGSSCALYYSMFRIGEFCLPFGVRLIYFTAFSNAYSFVLLHVLLMEASCWCSLIICAVDCQLGHTYSVFSLFAVVFTLIDGLESHGTFHALLRLCWQEVQWLLWYRLLRLPTCPCTPVAGTSWLIFFLFSSTYAFFGIHSSAFARRLCSFGEVAPLLLTCLCWSFGHTFRGFVSVVQFRNIAPAGLPLYM